MTAEVIEDDGVSRRERGAQDGAHIFQKNLSVHGRFDYHRRGDFVVSQCAHEGGCLPVAVGGRTDTAAALRRSAIGAGHIGGSPGFIDEYELFYVHRGQRFQPRFARQLHVRPILLAGVQRFF